MFNFLAVASTEKIERVSTEFYSVGFKQWYVHMVFVWELDGRLVSKRSDQSFIDIRHPAWLKLFIINFFFTKIIATRRDKFLFKMIIFNAITLICYFLHVIYLEVWWFFIILECYVALSELLVNYFTEPCW